MIGALFSVASYAELSNYYGIENSKINTTPAEEKLFITQDLNEGMRINNK